MSLEEGKVKSKERRELKGKKCMSSNLLERQEIIRILKATREIEVLNCILKSYVIYLQ